VRAAGLLPEKLTTTHNKKTTCRKPSKITFFTTAITAAAKTSTAATAFAFFNYADSDKVAFNSNILSAKINCDA